MSKKTQFLDFIDQKNKNYIPIGFWFHFVSEEEKIQGLTNTNIINKNVTGHQKYNNELDLDFIKIMSDGFCFYANDEIATITSIKQLSNIKPLGIEHPWIQEQVVLVKKILTEIGSDIATFYNIFSPATYFKKRFNVYDGNTELANFMLEDPTLTKHVLNVIAEDIATLTKEVIKAGVTGIYLSVQNIQDDRIDASVYINVIQDSELFVLNTAKQLSNYNILHICGNRERKNNIDIYQKYDFPVINWAVHMEDLSLKEGKQIFKNKIILGGFDNRQNSILISGSKSEIKQYTKNLLLQSGLDKIVLGADCTLPNDFDIARLNWVKEAINEIYTN